MIHSLGGKTAQRISVNDKKLSRSRTAYEISSVIVHEISNSICLATVTNTVKKYIDGGVEAVIDFKRNINSDNARRILDGRAEARIIELACDPVPKGHSRWTLRLLEEKSKMILDTPVSKDAIRRALKKTNFDLISTTTGASHQKTMPNS